MKKLFIAASLLIGMIAGAMVLSSFSEPKEEGNKDCMGICVKDDGWRRVGSYEGKTEDGNNKLLFVIWEKEGMCNSYYWTTGSSYSSENPDWHIEHKMGGATGALRQNRDGYWYAAYQGKNYFIDF